MGFKHFIMHIPFTGILMFREKINIVLDAVHTSGVTEVTKLYGFIFPSPI